MFINIAHLHPNADKARSVLNTHLFSDQVVVSSAQMLVSKYLPLGTEEINKWEDEPETFVIDEDADQWEFSLRVSSFKKNKSK